MYVICISICSLQASMICHGLSEEQLLKLPRSVILKLTRDLWISEAGTALRAEVDNRHQQRKAEPPSIPVRFEPKIPHHTILFFLFAMPEFLLTLIFPRFLRRTPRWTSLAAAPFS
jgi:hypothetical protein